MLPHTARGRAHARKHTLGKAQDNWERYQLRECFSDADARRPQYSAERQRYADVGTVPGSQLCERAQAYGEPAAVIMMARQLTCCSYMAKNTRYFPAW